jgi:hypothetical protein
LDAQRREGSVDAGGSTRRGAMSQGGEGEGWGFASTVICQFDDWSPLDKRGGGGGQGEGGGEGWSGGYTNYSIGGFRYSLYKDDGSFASGYVCVWEGGGGGGGRVSVRMELCTCVRAFKGVCVCVYCILKYFECV